MPKKICSNTQHVWRPTRGKYELCTICGTRYPCASLDCGHVDCYIDRGNKGNLPDSITIVDSGEPKQTDES